jgi:hypothetical protein
MAPVAGRSPIWATAEEFRAVLERKKTAIQKLCTAACEYLTLEIDAALEGFEHAQVVGPPTRATVKPEDLIEAQQRCEVIQSRIEELQEAIDRSPIPEMAVLLKTVMIPTIQTELEQATAYRDHLQRGLEQQTEPPSRDDKVVDLTGEPV